MRIRWLVVIGCVIALIYFFFFSDRALIGFDQLGSWTSKSALDPDVYHAPASPYHRGLNLVFFSDGYLSWKDFDRDVDIIVQGLRSIEPWKSYDRYNVYKILPKEVGICSVVTKDERKPVLRCTSEKTNAYLNRLVLSNNFKFIVLSRRDFQSWANVVRYADSGIFLSLPQSPKDTMEEQALGIQSLHLFGHAFGLKDEEIHIIAKAESAVMLPDGPNCAPDKETAEKWWGDLVGTDQRVGYYEGCSGKQEYIRPTEHSLMNLGDFSPADIDYGPVSERYLRKMLDYCFSDKLVDASADPEFFEQYPSFKSCVK